MQVIKCDFCGDTSDDAPGWLVLIRLPREAPKQVPSFAEMLRMPAQSGPQAIGTFCTPRCVADYATANVLADSVDPGEGPA